MLAAMASGSTVYIPDVATEDRWPDWRADVTAAKICSVLHVPMKAADQVIGVLSLYTQHPDAFTPDDEAIAYILARHASVAVATARQETSLALAVDARKLVGQAMGILMERFDVDGDRAFAILRRYSQDTNTKRATSPREGHLWSSRWPAPRRRAGRRRHRHPAYRHHLATTTTGVASEQACRPVRLRPQRRLIPNCGLNLSPAGQCGRRDHVQ
jgi:GAF domain-containing protein